MKSKKKRYKNLYIAEKSLEQLLNSTKNRKELAYSIEQDQSNFAKVCRLQTNPTLESYLACAQAFGFEVLLIHVPEGTIGKDVPVTTCPNSEAKLIAIENLATVLNKVECIDAKQLEQQVLRLLITETRQHGTLLLWLKRLLLYLIKILSAYGKS